MQLGASEYGPLRGLEQPYKTAGHLPALGFAYYGGILPARRPRERARTGRESDVRSTERYYRKVPSKDPVTCSTSRDIDFDCSPRSGL